VVADAVYASPTQQRQPYVFLPTRQTDTYGLTLVVHTRNIVRSPIPEIRETLRALDPEVATYGAITLDQGSHNAVNPQESAANIAAALALLALVLALVGLYGVVAYTVERRTREVGIRMALGAQPGTVIRLMLGQTTRVTLVGLLIGLLLAFGLGQAIASLLYGISASDPLTYLTIPAALLSVALIAAYIPARRATRVHPSLTLRQD
jgi:ABC-type antimicrobial peptide transport system permease subunit